MSPPARVDVVVVAAGRSSRMGGLDKLEAPLAGRPLLSRTLDALVASPLVARIVVVASPDRVERLRSLPWLPAAVAAVVPGGARRQESVAAGLEALARLDRDGGPHAAETAGPVVGDPDPGSSEGDVAVEGRIVLIHDGARPLVSRALIERVVVAAREHGAAIPVLPVAETLKRVEGDVIVATVDRSSLVAAQTPQGFRLGALHDAYRRFPPADSPEWTDEAALFEACRIPVHVVLGEPANLKVTLPDDLARADALLRPGPPGHPRVGIGRDSHPFGPGVPLALGGIEIPGAPRLHGHSDGDVALHAVADALLGAAGLGDLGRVFPAGPETPRGIDSSTLVGEVVRRVAAAGYRPMSADLTIVAARPRLAERLDTMRDAIARLLGVPPAAVNVKASTGNLAGMEGAGRGVSAEAVVQVEAIG